MPPLHLPSMGLFDSINSYLLASRYVLGYISSFSEPLFNVLHCKTCTEINIHTYIIPCSNVDMTDCHRPAIVYMCDISGPRPCGQPWLSGSRGQREVWTRPR